MKKLLLSLVAVFTAVSMAQAAPQFGLALTSADNLGIGGVNPGVAIVDSQWSAVVSFANTSKTIGSATAVKANSIGVKGNYKIPLSKATNATVGAAFNTVSGDLYKSYSDMRLLAGIQQNIASNIIFSADVNVYQSVTNEPKTGVKVTDANLLNGGSVGLVILF